MTATDRAVWRIALPMIISNISVPALGIVDTAVVGHLDSPQPLGAVAVGASIISLLFMSLNFLRMGTTGMTAQHFGRDDATGIRTVLGRAVIIAIVLGLVLWLLQGPAIRVALALMGAEPGISALADTYLAIRIWGAPATLANFALIGWFLGMQNARAPLMLMLATNLTNIILDLVFVVGLDLGVTGVALASVLGESAGLMIGIALVRRELRRRPGSWQITQLSSLTGLIALGRFNAHLFVRTLTLLFCFAFFTSRSSRLGGEMLAVNAVLMNFQYLLSYGLDGLAHAAEALVGKAYGARDHAAVGLAVTATLKWSLLMAAAVSLIFLLGGGLLIDLMTDLGDVRASARTFLPWLIASPLISVWSFLYDGVFVGATRAREMRDAMLLSAIIYVPTALWLESFGNHGLWFAFLLFMAARGVSMAWWWRKIAARPME
jgi:MATE family multidrug resistance protein